MILYNYQGLIDRGFSVYTDSVSENNDLLITVVIWNTHGRLLTIAVLTGRVSSAEQPSFHCALYD